MDDQERDEILHRLDERTDIMQNQIGFVIDDLDEQKKQIDEVDNIARKNRTMINTMTIGFASVITTGVSHLIGLLKL